MTRTRALLTVLLASLPAACGGGGYDLELLLPAGADMTGAAAVQLDVVRDGCDIVYESGFPPGPADVVRPFTWAYGEPPPTVGNLVPREYGFYVRIRSSGCIVRWAGCGEAKIEADGEGRIEVSLEAIDGPGCSVAYECDDAGVCREIESDAGP